MKIVFQGETKRFKDITDYTELMSHSLDTFKVNDDSKFKLYYLDDEGDLITVSCQIDLDEAYRCNLSGLKLSLAHSKEEASQNLSIKVINPSESSFFMTDSFIS